MVVQIQKIGKPGRPKLPKGQKGVKRTIYISEAADILCTTVGGGNSAVGAREIIDAALAKSLGKHGKNK